MLLSDEKSLIGEEDVNKEESHKDKDIFSIYLSDEETEDFAEEKEVQEMHEKEKILRKQEMEKQIVFKVEREAASRVKEKPD